MLVRVVSVVVVLVLSVVPSYGQSATAEFNGSVVDQSGAVLPGATITITNEATGLDADGHRRATAAASCSRPCSLVSTR